MAVGTPLRVNILLSLGQTSAGGLLIAIHCFPEKESISIDSSKRFIDKGCGLGVEKDFDGSPDTGTSGTIYNSPIAASLGATIGKVSLEYK